MEQTIEVIGVHPYPEAETPCHVLEMLVHGSDGDFPIFDFTQERPGMPQVDWKIPHLAKILDQEGTKVMADAAGTCDEIDLWLGDVRIAFFFYNLGLSLPFRTAFEEVTLPEPTPLPERLRCLEYQPEDA